MIIQRAQQPVIEGFQPGVEVGLQARRRDVLRPSARHGGIAVVEVIGALIGRSVAAEVPGEEAEEGEIEGGPDQAPDHASSARMRVAKASSVKSAARRRARAPIAARAGGSRSKASVRSISASVLV